MLVGELVARLSADLSQFNRDLSQAERQAKTSGARIGDVFRNALSFTIGMGMFEAVRAGFQSIIGTALDFNSMMEQASIGFTTMLGSAERAQAFLEEMGAFAAETPFEYPDLLTASRRLMAMGFAADEVLPTLRAVGDAASGLGLGREGIDRITLALGQMRAKAKVSGEEMRQLTEAGVPAWDILAKAMGKSTAEVMKLSEQGLIPADRAIQELVAGMEARFPNMMGKLANSWQGVTSTIRDVWRMTVGAITASLFSGLTNWLKGIRDLATQFYTTFRTLQQSGFSVGMALRVAIAQALGPDIAALLSTLMTIVGSIANVLARLAGLIRDHWATIVPVIWAVLAGFVMFRVVIPVIQAVRAAVLGLTAAVGALNAAVLALAVLLMAVAALWGAYSASVEKANLARVLGGIGGAAQGNKQLAVSSNEVASGANRAAGGLNKQADATKKAGKAAAQNIQSFDEVHQVTEDMADAAEEAAGGLGDLALPAPELPGLPDIGADALGAAGDALNVEGLMEGTKATLGGFFDWLKERALDAWQRVRDAAAQAWQWLQANVGPIWSAIAGAISGLWADLLATAGTIWNAIVGCISGTWSNISRTAVSIWGAVWDFLIGTWNNIRSTAETIFGAIWALITGKIDLRTFVRTVWLAITSFFSTQWGLIQTLASSIWSSITRFITQQWQLIQATAVTIWTAISAFFSSQWELIRALAITVWSSVADFVTRLWQRIQATAVTIWTAISDFLHSRWELMRALATAIWSSITHFVTQQWQLVRATAVTIWSAIRSFLSQTWTTIRETAAFTWEAIRTRITGIWQSLRSNATEVWGSIQRFIRLTVQEVQTWLESTWSGISSRLTSIWEGLRRTANDVWSGIWTTIRGIINNVIGGINRFIGAWNDLSFKLPAVNVSTPFGTIHWGGFRLDTPDVPLIPQLAEGGLVTAPTMAVVGEAGPEAVIPLGRSGLVDEMASSVAQSVYVAIRDAFRVLQAEGATQREIVLEIDGRQIGRAILPELVFEAQRTGAPVLLR